MYTFRASQLFQTSIRQQVLHPRCLSVHTRRWLKTYVFLALFVYGLRGFPHSPVYNGSRNLDTKRSLTLSQLYIFLPCKLTKIGRVHRTKLIILRKKARQKRMEKCCFQSSILLQSAFRYNVIVLCGKDLVFSFKTNYIISVNRREQTQC